MCTCGVEKTTTIIVIITIKTNRDSMFLHGPLGTGHCHLGGRRRDGIPWCVCVGIINGTRTGYGDTRKTTEIGITVKNNSVRHFVTVFRWSFFIHC